MYTHNLKYIISFLLLILFIGGCSEEIDASGCPHPDSCNYNPDGIDEESCWYAEENYDCDDECIIEVDCNDICGGNWITATDGECCPLNLIDDCGVCDGPGEVLIEYDDIDIIATLNPWNLGMDYMISNEAIFIFSENCSDDYDSNDIPEPPVFGTNWIKTYFHYPNWDSAFGNNFTETCHSNIICNIKVISFFVESNALGPLSIFIEFPVQSNLQIEVFENTLEPIELTENTVSGVWSFESNLEANITKEFLIKVSVD